MRSRRVRFVSAVAAVAFFACAMHEASAADEATSVAAATALFDEALALMDRGKYAEACPKLARSNDIAPSGGTLLALGECYERVGRTASAWLAYREAAARAAKAGKAGAEADALSRAARVGEMLSRLTVRLAEGASMQGVEVRRDGVVVKPAELGTAVPLDPGTHLVEATAPGHRTWSARVALAASGDVDVNVPALEIVAPGQEDATAASPAASPDPGSTQRTVGLVVAGAGAALLGAGAVFGLVASSTNDEALSNCNTSLDPPRCNARGLELTDDARSQALVSTILTVAGAAAITGGAVLWLTAPVRVSPTVGSSSAGLSARVLF